MQPELSGGRGKEAKVEDGASCVTHSLPGKAATHSLPVKAVTHSLPGRSV